MSSLKRAQQRVHEVCRRARTPAELLAGVQQALAPELPVDRWCGLTLDPTTSLPTGGVHVHGLSPSRVPHLLELEFDASEVNRLGFLARAKNPIATLSSVTGGDNASSARYRDILAPDGIEHELRAVFRDGNGPWAALVLMRAGDVSDFEPKDVALLSSLSSEVTLAMRRVLLLAEISQGAAAQAPALILLAGRPVLSVRYVSASAQRWLAEIDDGTTERLPYALYSLALCARSQVHALARLRTRQGRWLTAHADCVNDGGSGDSVSLIIESSRPHEVAQLLGAAYGLTQRESEVVRLVAAGCANAEIGQLLFISRYTVEDHLKKLFEKLSVSSRSGLVSKLFFDHYLPRTQAGAVVGGNGCFIPTPPVSGELRASEIAPHA